jgi:methyltransferase (TIGR00027 family)
MSTPLVSQPSASALNVARCRAIAAHEAREDIRGADVLAEVFLGEAARQSLQDPATHASILKKLDEFSPGAYEYFIARTAYLDGIVEQALRDHVPQLALLGAGYDTRAYRFRHLLEHTRVFELDCAATQQHKRSLLAQAQVAIPEQLAFIPLDFTSDSLLDKLAEAGYCPDQLTLFVWEGVSYYLPPASVDETLRFVRLNAAPGSILCFDYMLPASQLEGRYGAQQARTAMQTIYTAEPLQFDLDEAQAAAFLAERGFEMIEHVTPQDMQTRYLTLRDGTLAGQVLDLFRLVQARVAGP